MLRYKNSYFTNIITTVLMIFQNAEYNTRVHVYIEVFRNKCSNFVASCTKLFFDVVYGHSQLITQTSRNRFITQWCFESSVLISYSDSATLARNIYYVATHHSVRKDQGRSWCNDLFRSGYRDRILFGVKGRGIDCQWLYVFSDTVRRFEVSWSLSGLTRNTRTLKTSNEKLRYILG